MYTFCLSAKENKGRRKEMKIGVMGWTILITAGMFASYSLVETIQGQVPIDALTGSAQGEQLATMEGDYEVINNTTSTTTAPDLTDNPVTEEIPVVRVVPWDPATIAPTNLVLRTGHVNGVEILDPTEKDWLVNYLMSEGLTTTTPTGDLVLMDISLARALTESDLPLTKGMNFTLRIPMNQKDNFMGNLGTQDGMMDIYRILAITHPEIFKTNGWSVPTTGTGFFPRSPVEIDPLAPTQDTWTINPIPPPEEDLPDGIW
jgi:hypothetical protein